jgi:O-acetyl-ADP-ribose deacetylase (regulator of RNase III)
MTKVATILTDITELGVDVIVNAANEDMRGGGGVDGAIHDKAGHELVLDTVQYAPLYVSRVAITSGYKLKARNIIHTVGPMYGRGNSGEYIALEMCYRNSLAAAESLGAKTIAIPAISAGVYGFPKDRAAKIAVTTCLDVAKDSSLEEILLVAYDETTLNLYKKYLSENR